MSSHDMKFHRDIGIPNELNIPTGRLNLRSSPHAKNRSNEHKFGEFEIPNEIYVTEQEVVEAKTKQGELWRMLVRTNYNEEFDICIVLNVNTFEVVTAWRNHVTDTHSSLNRSQYDDPQEF